MSALLALAKRGTQEAHIDAIA